MALNINFPKLPKIEMSNLITEVPRIPNYDDIKTNNITSAIDNLKRNSLLNEIDNLNYSIKLKETEINNYKTRLKGIKSSSTIRNGLIISKLYLYMLIQKIKLFIHRLLIFVYK